MDTRPKSGELIEATVEEVAAWLSATEGRAVSIQEVRRIEWMALRKVRRMLGERGVSPKNLLPE
jgi:hypothetical protein